jgi:hypothetical protein
VSGWLKAAANCSGVTAEAWKTGSMEGQSQVQHSTAQHSTAQHSTAQHSTAQHSRLGEVKFKK